MLYKTVRRAALLSKGIESVKKGSLHDVLQYGAHRNWLQSEAGTSCCHADPTVHVYWHLVTNLEMTALFVSNHNLKKILVTFAKKKKKKIGDMQL